MPDNNESPLLGAKILIVEDNPLISLEVEQALSDLGCNVVSFSALPDALASIKQQRFDFILADFFLEDANSLPLIKAAMAQDIPHALLTGYSIPDDDPWLARTTIITKPFKQREIIDHILSALENASAKAEDHPSADLRSGGDHRSLDDVEPC